MAVRRVLTLDQAKQLGFGEDAVSTTVDTDKQQIVGWVEGSGFSSSMSHLAHPVFGYLFFLGEEPEPRVTVYATTLTVAILTLGFGDSYEEEWGDFRDLLDQLHRWTLDEPTVFVARKEILPVSEVDLQQALCELGHAH